MSEHDLVARSPIAPPAPHVLHGWEVSARVSLADLTLRDETPLAKVLVRAPFDGTTATALGVRFGRTARGELPGAGPTLTIGSGPGEWLVLGPVGSAPTLRRALETHLAGTDELVSVVDLTHGRALVRLHGRAAAQALAKVCGIDLADRTTPDGTALRTSVARVVTDLVRDDRDGLPSYLLHCERSSGQYLFDALADAGTEFGVETTGFASGPATIS